MNFQQLKSELDAGKKRNLYIFTGEEREVLRKYIQRICEGTNIIKAETFKDIISLLRFKSLIPQKRTFLLEDDSEITNIQFDKVLEIVGNNTLILTFKNIDKRKRFFKESAKYITEFNKFSEHQLVGYIQKQIVISDELAFILARYCNNEVSRIDIECHKLRHIEKEITLELLNDLIEPPLEDRIFDMIDFVAKKKQSQAFDIYFDLIELKESPIKIVSLLYTKFKQVFLVQSNFNLSNADLSAKTGLNFGQVKFAKELCGNFSLERLLEILKLIQQTEVEMKTGQVDLHFGMECLLYEILYIDK